MESSFSFAEVCFVDEFCASLPREGSSLRLVGRLLDAERVANPDNDEEYVLVDFSLIPGWQMVTGLVSLVGETCLLPDANNDNRLGIRPRLLLNHFQVDYAALRATVEKRRKFLL